MIIDYLDRFNFSVVEFGFAIVLLITTFLFAFGWKLMANFIEGK